MLLDFKFSNFRSFYEEQNLSFEATALKGREECIFETKDPQIKKALPVSILMGSNASGKSNLLKALDYMKSQVFSSYSKNNDGEGSKFSTQRDSFSLSSDAASNPSTFEISFIEDEVPYRYGFSCNDNEFTEEWLYAYPLGQQQKWFTRKNGEYDFGKKFLGQKTALSDITPMDSLFLSVGIRSKHQQLEKLSNFFRNTRFDYPSLVTEIEISRRLINENIDDRVIEFLRLLDTGIYGYKIQPKQITDADKIFSEEIEKFFVAYEKRTLEDLAVSNKNSQSSSESSAKNEKKKLDYLDHLKTHLHIYFKHSGADKGSIGISFNEESDGTKRLLRLVQDAFTALDNGYLLVVDEIDASLHTRACELFLGLFLTPELNNKGAQLLATTHNTNLLSYKELRRDEAWFVEKQLNGQSHVYSAAEFKMRAEKNLEKAYLDDRFGALPSKIDPRLLVGSIE